MSCKGPSEKKAQKKLAAQPAFIEKDPATVNARADSLYALAEIFLAANKKDSGLYYHEQALDLREKAGKNDKAMLDSYLSVGRLYRDEVKYNTANTFYEKAEPLIVSIGLPVEEEINFLFEFSNIKSNLMDIATSISLLNRLSKLIERNHIQDRVIQGRIHMSLGNAFISDNQFKQAILQYKRAVSEYEPFKDYYRAGIAFTSLGMVYNKMNDHHNALINFRKAIQNHLKWTDPDSAQLADVYLQKAVTHQDLSENDSARFYFQRNLNIRVKLYGEKDPNTFGAKLNLGQYFESIHSYDSAVKYSQECLISLVRDFNNHDIFINPIPKPTELNIDLVAGLVSKANALKSLSENNPQRDYNDFALTTYLLADSIYSVFIRNLKYDDPQLRELETRHIPYDQMIDLAFHLYEKTGENDYLKKSMHIMEQSRAVLLDESLSRAQEYEYDTTRIFHALRKEENQLINQRSEILRQLSLNDLSQAVSDSLGDALLVVNRSFVELQKAFELNNPNYFNFKYNRKAFDIREIQSLLKIRNSIFFEYLWSEEKIYVLAIEPESIKIKIIPQTDAFKVSFNNFIRQLQISAEEAIRQENFNQFCQSASALYQILISDLLSDEQHLKKNKNLIFSTNGPLTTFPFEALITGLPASEEVNYRLPYLIYQHPISYAYSATILINQSKRERDGNKLLALGFAGSGNSQAQRNGLNDLPGTEKEINSIKGVMKNATNKYFLENDASEFTFKNQVSNFDMVHLAIHGVADSTNALKSRLVFRPEADTIEDSNLFAHELYSLNLDKLDLAVLSACESGIGKQQAGEGAMSIARGFAYAGCPSLVISLWKIDDRTSAQVMSTFYKHVSLSKNLDLALAHSKIDYLTSAKEFNSHPSYWAAFLQVGDTRAIDTHKDNMKYWLMTIVLLAGLMGWMLRKRLVHVRQ